MHDSTPINLHHSQLRQTWRVGHSEQMLVRIYLQLRAARCTTDDQTTQDYTPMTREEVAKKCTNQEVELHKDLVVTIGQMHLTTLDGHKSTVVFSSL